MECAQNKPGDFMLKRTLTDYTFIALGALILALGLNVFLVPLRLSVGGVGAIGTVLLYLINIPLSVTNLVINAILFIVGYKYLGKAALVKTVAGILFLSLFLSLTENLPACTDDILLAALFGGLLCGVGVGVVVRFEGSTGGSDFAAVILNRIFAHMSVPMLLLLLDLAVVFVSGLIFESVSVMLYSMLALAVAAKTADVILTMGDMAKSIFILSEKTDEIARYIHEKIDRGVTGVHSRGMYAKKDRLMLLCAVSPKQLPVLVHGVKQIDQTAFIIIMDAHQVMGEGFKQ